jgi:hypothetical protein
MFTPHAIKIMIIIIPQYPGRTHRAILLGSFLFCRGFEVLWTQLAVCNAKEFTIGPDSGRCRGYNDADLILCMGSELSFHLNITNFKLVYDDETAVYSPIFKTFTPICRRKPSCLELIISQLRGYKRLTSRDCRPSTYTTPWFS